MYGEEADDIDQEQKRDELGGFRIEELDNVSEGIEQLEGENDNLNGDELPAKKPVKQLWKYDKSKIIEEDNGMKMLFQNFTMQRETFDTLRLTKGSELNDLNKVMGQYRKWHLIHCPKMDYYLFLEKLQKLGKEQEVQAYLEKMRSHYKGEQISEEFNFVQPPEESK